MALMRGSGGVWVARPVHTALLAVCASLLGLHAPVAAQTISVFGARSILQYNAQNDRSFGGWRLGLALGAGEELGLQVSGGYWSDVRGRKDLGGADGRDFQAVVRYGLIATPRATVALEAGLGGFRGPEPVGGTSGRPVGRLVIVGLSVLAVPVWPFGLELGGYFRDDVGSFDLEGRVGVRAFLRREKGEGRRGRRWEGEQAASCLFRNGQVLPTGRHHLGRRSWGWSGVREPVPGVRRPGRNRYCPRAHDREQPERGLRLQHDRVLGRAAVAREDDWAVLSLCHGWTRGHRIPRGPLEWPPARRGDGYWR